jgi:hypothetical protein
MKESDKAFLTIVIRFIIFVLPNADKDRLPRGKRLCILSDGGSFLHKKLGLTGIDSMCKNV